MNAAFHSLCYSSLLFTRLGKVLKFTTQKQGFGARGARAKPLFLRETCQVVYLSLPLGMRF